MACGHEGRADGGNHQAADKATTRCVWEAAPPQAGLRVVQGGAEARRQQRGAYKACAPAPLCGPRRWRGTAPAPARLAAPLRDALVAVAGQLLPRGAADEAVPGRPPLLVLLAVLHLLSGGRRELGSAAPSVPPVQAARSAHLL